MAHHEVLLIKPVDGLGAEGDQVKVRAGYARNYLLPQKFAVALTQSNRKQVEALKKRRISREAEELTGAQALAAQIGKVSVAFVVKTGEGGKLFGAITSADLHQKLTEAGVVIEKKKIHLHTPVKTLGKHEVKIKLHPEVSLELAFDVVSENPIVEAGAAEAAPAKEVDPYAEHTKMAQNAARAAEKAAKRSRK
ncbi:MAG TPA: 50S ribosomal protein L9 [Rariglobus sp.]|jgi:large subunit ribosomal protein L9|nr:50S ribosomal protein L9 [Rariglobus sp.]